MKKIIYRVLTVFTLAGSALGLQSCGDWLDINTNELAATKTEPGYLFNYAAINYSSKRVGGDQWLPITFNTLYLNFAFLITGLFSQILLALLINEIGCKWFKKIAQSLMDYLKEVEERTE